MYSIYFLSILTRKRIFLTYLFTRNITSYLVTLVYQQVQLWVSKLSLYSYLHKLDFLMFRENTVDLSLKLCRNTCACPLLKIDILSIVQQIEVSLYSKTHQIFLTTKCRDTIQVSVGGQGSLKLFTPLCSISQRKQTRNTGGQVGSKYLLSYEPGISQSFPKQRAFWQGCNGKHGFLKIKHIPKICSQPQLYNS